VPTLYAISIAALTKCIAKVSTEYTWIMATNSNYNLPVKVIVKMDIMRLALIHTSRKENVEFYCK